MKIILIVIFMIVGLGVGLGGCMWVLEELFGGQPPCVMDGIIEDVLKHNGYIAGDRKDKLKDQLMYEVKYYDLDRHSKVVKRLRELEKELKIDRSNYDKGNKSF